MSSGKVIILFLKESNKCPARSFSVKAPSFTAKSGRPTSPIKRASPVKTQGVFPSSSVIK